MQSRNQIARRTKYSNPASTPDSESVNPLAQLSQTNNSILPTKIEGDIRDHSEENTQRIGNVDESTVVGAKVHNSNVQQVTQNNQTGCNITGTGHTINIYQYPKELDILINNLIGKYP
jgi:hypothetical protein